LTPSFILECAKTLLAFSNDFCPKSQNMKQKSTIGITNELLMRLAKTTSTSKKNKKKTQKSARNIFKYF
jgi:hypothetical protein